MDLLHVDPLSPSPEAIERAAERLRAGELVAFPTETVYGLGADATNAAAVSAIYEAKGRPSINPLIVHLPDSRAAQDLAGAWPEAARRLAERFWPGPLTLVLPRAAALPDAVTAGLDTIGLRVPSHPVAHALLSAAGVPVAAPSANLSTRLSPTTAAHVAAGLTTTRGLVIDGGPTPVGIESTVVSLVDEPTLLRPGAIPAVELEAIVGPLVRRPGPERTSDAALPSPGMMERHYAPRATLHLFAETERNAIPEEVGRARREGRVTGALLRTAIDAPFDHLTPMPDNARDYGRLLYASLHALDRAGADEVWVEAPPSDDAWEAIRDRLRRATSSWP